MEENQLVPYDEVSIGTDENENEIKLLQNGAIILRTKHNEITDINKNIKELRESIKKLKQEKENAEKSIMPIMVKRGIECINVTNGRIKYSEKYKAATLNKKNLQKMLISFFTDNENIQKLNSFNDDNAIERATLQTDLILNYINSVNKKTKIVSLKTEFS